MPDRFVLIRKHASLRMLQRRITLADVLRIVDAGLAIERYPDDVPFPSQLMLGWVREQPIHVVMAEEADTIHIITVYEPNPQEWSPDFTRRIRE